MVKKFVMLIVFLGMASMASASLLFTDNSDISASATLSLDITAADESGYRFYIVATDTATVGTIGAGTVGSIGNLSFDRTVDPYYPNYYLHIAMDKAGLATDGSVSANFGFVGDSGGGPLSGTAITGIAFTMVGTGTIDLYTSATGMTGTWSVVDTITVVPEPMTMVLLGLGGLFLRRRK